MRSECLIGRGNSEQFPCESSSPRQAAEIASDYICLIDSVLSVSQMVVAKKALLYAARLNESADYPTALTLSKTQRNLPCMKDSE